MKTVFEGIVNGQKFDNVADYNTALTQAIQTGNVIQASSKTYTQKEEYDQDIQDVRKEDPIYYIGMDPDHYYMDIMTGNEETDDYTLEQCCNVLDDNYDKIIETLEKINDEDLVIYSANLNKIADKLKNDFVSNNKLLNQIDEEIKSLHKRINDLNTKSTLCSYCKELNRNMVDYYDNLINAVQEEIEYRSGQSHEVEMPQTTVTEVQAQQETILNNLKGVQKLLDEIFNK